MRLAVAPPWSSSSIRAANQSVARLRLLLSAASEHPLKALYVLAIHGLCEGGESC